jgi:hypothetical protein
MLAMLWPIADLRNDPLQKVHGSLPAVRCLRRDEQIYSREKFFA